MDMDKTPLNKAHQLERQAEVLSRQKKLEECMQCHLEAAELYEQCLQVEGDKNALESIQLQKEWNERQIRMIQLKKSYLERTEKAKKLKVTSSSKRGQNDEVEHLEAKIFKNFETHDSLICYLAQRGIIKTSHRDCQSVIEEVDEPEGPFVVGSKHPKDDSIIIEELKELSGQLRESVQGLLIQLDDRNREIEQLKSQLKNLELEKSFKQVGKHDDSSPSLSEASEFSMEFQSLPPLEFLPVLPEIDLNCFKQYKVKGKNTKH